MDFFCYEAYASGVFHGDKTEYKNGAQANRNRFLVDIGNEILEKLIYSIAEN